MPEGDSVSPAEFSELTPIPMGRNVRGERREKRHDGRTLKTSICDLIDNSIDAGASDIYVRYATDEYRGSPKGSLMIKDNGNGINKDKMLLCLSFNSHRSGGYEHWELGSFGVGLDDSCLAHGQEITVFSREENAEFRISRLSCELTDLAENDWILINHDDLLNKRPDAWNTNAFQSALSQIKSMDKGTIVLLEDMAPLNEEIDENNTIDPLDEIENFIAMTFCDYLVGIDLGPRDKENPLKIFFNDPDNPIIPLDPFFKNNIGSGPFNGQQGTLFSPFEFNHNGMEFTINRYITPNRRERDRIGGNIDNRLVSAIGNSIENCQGIYFKRNGRILDGPWNGENWRRTQGMGMGTNHHTSARWEFVMPPESIEDPQMVPPDKQSVRTDAFQTHILNAKNERLVWHEEDETAYGGGQYSNLVGGCIYTTRARSHNNSNDLITICSEANCEVRIPYDSLLCERHDVRRCTNCSLPLNDSDESICQNCTNLICQSENCRNFVETVGDTECLSCQQPICEAPGCTERSMIQTEFCEVHEREVCVVAGCRNLSHNDFNKCNNHLLIYAGDGGMRVRLVKLEQAGPIIHEDGEILVNLNHADIQLIAGRIIEEN